MQTFLSFLQWLFILSGITVWVVGLLLVIYYHHCKPRWEVGDKSGNNRDRV